MTFQTVPVQIVGPSYKHRSLPLSAQTCKMLYPEPVPTGKTPGALLSWPGLKNFSASASAADRGMHVMGGVLYQVYGNTLCSVNSSGTRTTIGTVLGSGKCIFADDGANLVIVTGSTGYYYDGTLNTINDADYAGGNSVAQYNSVFVYHNGDDDYCVSDPGTPNTINGLNKSDITTVSGNIKRVFIKDKLVYFIKEHSFEVFYVSGTGNPPLDEIQNAKGSVGASSPHGVTETKDYIYFFGSDHQVYRIQQFQEQQITPSPLGNEFESYTTISDVQAYTVLFEGQRFIVFRFPTEGKSWAFCENADSWIELTTDNLEAIYPCSSTAFAYNKVLMADADTAEIWELDVDTYTHDGTEVIRERVTKPISGDDIEKPGQRLLMDRFELILETGVGTATGQGVNPRVMFSASFDGGKSWTNEDTVVIGRTGEGRIRVEWYHSESFLQAAIRVRISDPVFLAIHSAAIDVKEDGPY